MDLVIWSYIFGGATIFALIVGMFSVWNGRMTRRELREVITRTSEQTSRIIESTSKETQAILSRIDEHMQQMDRHMQQMDEHMKQMDGRHTQFLEKIANKVANL